MVSDKTTQAILDSGKTRYAVAKEAGVPFAVLNQFVRKREICVCEAFGLALVKRK